jgi:hypothetical protein
MKVGVEFTIGIGESADRLTLGDGRPAARRVARVADRLLKRGMWKGAVKNLFVDVRR